VTDPGEVSLKEHVEEAAEERRRLSQVRWADHMLVHAAEHERLLKALDRVEQKLAAQDANIRREVEQGASAHAEVDRTEYRAVETAVAGVHREAEIHRSNHQREHISDQRAVDLAGNSVDKRLEAMNEFRDQLSDQSGTFVRTDVLNEMVAKLEQRAEVNRLDIQHLREEAAAGVGKKKGIDSTTAAIYAGMVLLVMVAGIVVSYLASHH